MSTATSVALEERAVKWLLNQEHPGIRYWALRDLLGESANDPEVSSYRNQIASHGPVVDLLAEQHPDGYWGHPEDCYWPKWQATVWPLILLAEMGLPGDNPRIRSACEYYLKTAMEQDKSWPPPDYPEGDLTGYRLLWEPCVTGNMARTLVQFGHENDPRVRGMFDWLIRTQLPDGGWNCEPGPWGMDNREHTGPRTRRNLNPRSTIRIHVENKARNRHHQHIHSIAYPNRVHSRDLRRALGGKSGTRPRNGTPRPVDEVALSSLREAHYKDARLC